MKRILTMLAVAMAMGLSLCAQELQYQLMRGVETSPANELRCLLFDHNGLLWMGTTAGLRSYDGYRTRVYSSDAYSPDILPNNTVMSMAEDGDGGLWIGTRDGLARMDSRTGRFRTYRLPSNKQRIIYCLYTGHDGTIWIGTDAGLTRYVKEKDDFETFSLDRTTVVDTEGRRVKLEEYSVKSIAEDRKGHLFVGTWCTGLFRVYPEQRRFVQYPQRNRLNSAFSLYFDEQDRLWVGTWGHGVERLEHPLDLHDQGWKSFGVTPNSFNRYYRVIGDPVSGTIWACCREGVSVLQLAHEEQGFVNYGSLTGRQGREVLNFVNDIKTDGRGNIWIGTMTDGVKHVSTRAPLFQLAEMHPAEGAASVASSSVAAIFSTDYRHFWLGLHPYGIALHDRVTGQTLLNEQIGQLQGLGEYVFQTAMPSIVGRQNGEIWVANGSHGIVVVPPEGMAWLWNTKNAEWVEDDYVNALYVDRRGRTWVGQRTRLSVVEPDGQGRRLTLSEGKTEFSNCDVRGISEDHRGNIWIATENEGIVRVDTKGTCHHYCPAVGNYAVEDASQCFEDGHHRLWAVSGSSGLFRYEREEDRFVPVRREYHMGRASAYAIGEDAHGRLWLTTDRGLVRLSFDEGRDGVPEVNSYTQEDGLVNMKFMPNAILRYGERLVLGTRGGVYTFIPPKDMNRAKEKSRLMVTDIWMDDTPFSLMDSAMRANVSTELPSHTRDITVPASVNKFVVEMALLTYMKQEQNKYAYRLEGYDSDWRFMDASQRQAAYENIPAGTYKLYLGASDSYGTWTQLPYAITVHVLPPWYRTWWAYLLYTLLLSVVVLGVVRWYQHYLQTQSRLQMIGVFTSITHELLTPLTVISASIDELRVKAPQGEENYGVIQNNITRLYRLLRQILEVRKQQAGQLRLRVSLGNLTEFVRTKCANILPMANTRGQQVETELEEVNGFFDADKLDKIVYNLLSNALKYSHDGGRVRVTLSETEGVAVLKVADEGIGIPRAKMKHLYSLYMDGEYRRMNTEGTGLGLALTQELVKLHRGHIECVSQENVGTTFTVTLPMEKEAYKADEVKKDEQKGMRKNPQRMVLTDTETTETIESEETERKVYTLLLVEDNVELLGLMKRLLGRTYKVLTAKHGGQAWDIIQREELDMVISDVMMPVMDGIELTRTIKDSENYAQLPVILLTARTRDEDRQMGYETGADEYLTKPFKLAELKLRVRNILDNRERIRRHFCGQMDFDVSDEHYSSPDELFLRQAMECVKRNLEVYDRESFARDMCVSSSTLYKKLVALTGLNVTAFIMSVRLKEACRIVREHPDVRVGELATMVGINSPKYFTRCFKEEFGELPSEYIERVKNEQRG